MKPIQALSVLFFAAIFTFGCRSTKSLSSAGELDANMTSRILIKEHLNQNSRFKTLQARVKLDYTQDQKTQGYTVNLRIEKDKVIWINATLGLARAMITPDKVQFYDKINNQYFDGDYRLLSDLLGITLDFKKVQSLLLGETIFNLREGTYTNSTHEGSYVLQPKDQLAILELFYLINPGHFKLDSQQLFQPLKRRMLQVDYTKYQEVQNQIVPEQFKIIAVEDTEEVSVEMEYKSVTLNEKLRFPFTIPSGFKEIQLEHAD
ncbi:uncharacterized protein DUF4292 [Flavobacteriaceae bacterium MAR_2010_72]|nr:uncharacterized protein DUF4292 [Flavobacteriaceae bacterium MAR_2010_72]TVZ58230.1 uncharacterized protein DUF4292 [Flavobacteriaceae bacterium MAR_2010_105]